MWSLLSAQDKYSQLHKSTLLFDSNRVGSVQSDNKVRTATIHSRS